MLGYEGAILSLHKMLYSITLDVYSVIYLTISLDGCLENGHSFLQFQAMFW